MPSDFTGVVPFFRPSLGDQEIGEVVAVLQSGWLTTGPKVKQLEEGMLSVVRGKHAVAVNSATAALHLAVEALGLAPRQGVLVPTLTFAATAEIVRYLDAVPILVDCNPVTLNIDLGDAEVKCRQVIAGTLPGLPAMTVGGIIPVHVGGQMVDMSAVRAFAAEHRLWVVEDAAHALPAAWRAKESEPWTHCGDATADVTCFSFYANKTITTGEGGMAVTSDAQLADRMRLMSLHGLSKDAWNRYSGGNWDYRIVAPGFKYNLTDIAAAIGIHQVARAETFRQAREAIAVHYQHELGSVEEIELPAPIPNRLHSWHLFPIRLRLERLRVDRAAFITAMTEAGVGTSVHWRPLHLHPYYEQQFGWRPEQFPVASREWLRLISIPIFPSMTGAEQAHVIETIRSLCAKHRR